MVTLDGSSVLLQWATGGLGFLWLTNRHRLVGAGYGWLLRSSFGLLALGAFLIGVRFDFVPVRDIAALLVALVSIGLLIYSFLRSRQQPANAASGSSTDTAEGDIPGRALLNPQWDLVAPVIGVVGLVGAGLHVDEAGAATLALAVVRMLVGAAFMGAVSDAMLLGHWYLVQPGLSRTPLRELTIWTGVLWLPETVLFLIPEGMVSVWSGAIDDGYAGMLGWFWGACVVTTIALVIATLLALKEKQYEAVMAATGLLYLAILTGFGIDLVARAILG